MTKFEDQLYTDLMREHGSTLADTRLPGGARRQFASRRALLATGAGGLAVAATATALTVGGGTASPAYALTTHPDGTVTLAVYKAAGIAQANARLHQLGDNVVVVPTGPGCPNINTLPPPAVPIDKDGITVTQGRSRDGSISVRATGIPDGDILVVAVETTPQGSAGDATVTSPPAPGCVSMNPVLPPPGSRSNVAHSTTFGAKIGAGAGQHVVHRSEPGQSTSRKGGLG